MLASFRNMFRVADLRNKVLFTLLVIAIYQFGTNVPIPGVDFAKIEHITNAARSNGIIGYLSLFAGTGLSKAAVLGLGIMPYITASIIVQLLTPVIPKFDQWRDQGAVGQRKLTQATRYLTVGLALMQSSGIVFLYHSGRLFENAGLSAAQADLIPDFTWPRVLFMILVLTAGTAFVMWLGEMITQRGIGNGMSLLIFSNVISAIPIYGQFIKNDRGWLGVAIVVAICLLLITAIVFMEQGQRRIPVTFAKRVQGRRMYGGQSTYIPLKVNQAGVIPIIFASSLLYIPVLLSNVIPWSTYRNWVNHNLLNPIDGVYLVVYGVLIVLFTFFYVHVQFDPYQQADQIRKQGGYIPGFRPGPPTERYLSRILNRLTLPGSLFLAFVALIPSVLLRSWHVNNIPFFGTTLLIAVGVALETMKQIDSQLMMRNYQGFLQ
ncbi:MAG TPA: preprotein translocase subunit SecY [Acidimicrobiales bacterium]|nr:preprotein translocase subunit SecY [Acidimicrobiales bacterium]